jgi:hypothetical protein
MDVSREVLERIPARSARAAKMPRSARYKSSYEVFYAKKMGVVRVRQTYVFGGSGQGFMPHQWRETEKQRNARGIRNSFS